MTGYYRIIIFEWRNKRRTGTNFRSGIGVVEGGVWRWLDSPRKTARSDGVWRAVEMEFSEPNKTACSFRVHVERGTAWYERKRIAD
jgi:hypothetical protein